VFLLLLPAAGAAGLAWPTLQLSATEVDFGLVPRGTAGSASVSVTNAGDLPMGLRAAVTGWPDGAFLAAWPATCDDGAALLPGDDDPLPDTGSPSPPLAAGAAAELGAEAVLPPGCTVTLALSYTPDAGDRGAGALVLTASGTYPHGRSDFQQVEPGWAEDPVDFRQVVRLVGTSDGERPAESHPQAFYVDATPSVCHEGEDVRVRAGRFDPDGEPPFVSWSSDDANGVALFGAPEAEETTFRCPEVESDCGERVVTVYARVADAEGYDAWQYASVIVLDSSVLRHELFVPGTEACPASEGPTGTDSCGDCGQGSAGLFPGLALGVLARRRRRARD
jgi:hypothetical protein